MIVKTSNKKIHVSYLKDIVGLVWSQNMRLNPAKYSFGVQAVKLLGFILTKRGIEVNPVKCQATVDTRISSNIKEVHQLIECLAAPTCFLSCAGNKAFYFFAMLKKKDIFEWTSECNEELLNLEAFIASPPIITLPI